MDLRVLVLSAESDLGDLVRAQVENLGCRCTVATSYDEASAAIGWADAAIIDLAGDGLDDLNRLRVEAPTIRIVAIAPEADKAESAKSSGVDLVLTEPFSIADLVKSVRAIGRADSSATVDLDAAEATPDPADDAPWWATR